MWPRDLLGFTDMVNCGTVVGIMYWTTKLLGYALLRVVGRWVLLMGRCDALGFGWIFFVKSMVLRYAICTNYLRDVEPEIEQRKTTVIRPCLAASL